MAECALVQKLKVMPGQRMAVVEAPSGYLETLTPLPEGAELVEDLNGMFDWVQLFTGTRADLERLLPSVRAALKPESLLWITFPKGTSRIQTDLTRDKGWDAVREADLKWLNLISVNDTWSAFSLRPYKPGEQRQPFR
jgi:hypothetical protein